MKPLLLQTLEGSVTPRRPVWIMRQAGRYLPEYRALRQQHSFEELAGDPALATEVTLQPMRRFPLDAAIVFADLMSPVGALGIDVRFDPGPVLDRAIRSAADVRALPVPDSEEVAPEVIETLRRVRRELPTETALLGFAGSPWSLAAYLVQGHGKTGFPALRALLASDPVVFGELMDKLAQLAAGYLVRQARAGADAVQVFESWAGLLSLSDWERHVRPHVARLLQELEQAEVPRILFLQGAPYLAEPAASLPADGLAVCWRCDLATLRQQIGESMALQGNLDPAVLLAGPEVTRQAVGDLLARVPARGHVFNLGHGILPETPLESVSALLEEVHREELS